MPRPVPTPCPAAPSLCQVISIFYLDACGTILSAIDASRQALRPGGLWISIGPLEFNGTDGGHAGGMRLSGDELLALICARGFEMVEVRDVPCAYTQDQRSMLHQQFDCLMFVARRVEKGAPASQKQVPQPVRQPPPAGQQQQQQRNSGGYPRPVIS